MKIYFLKLEPGVDLQSPEQLKYKILCKFRKKISKFLNCSFNSYV